MPHQHWLGKLANLNASKSAGRGGGVSPPSLKKTRGLKPRAAGFTWRSLLRVDTFQPRLFDHLSVMPQSARQVFPNRLKSFDNSN